ncbi:MAG: HYR domain-containing protein [Marinilabiliales bacterium]|nr:HYR domain-containing protein [Marinilabiliales bacterium]
MDGTEFDATFTDNCAATITNDLNNSATLDGYSIQKGLRTIIWTVTDGAGNSSTCSITVTVNDDESPAIVCPEAISAGTNPGICGAIVPYVPPVGTDSCPDAITVQTGGLASGATFPVGVTTNTFKVTDAVGHSTTCSFTVTVLDDEDPVITDCPDDITQTADKGLCSAQVTITPATATDNCAVTSVVGVRSDAPATLTDPYPVGRDNYNLDCKRRCRKLSNL